MIMAFAYEYTYQDREYIIRTMNTKHSQCTYTCIHSACNQTGFPAPGCTQDCTQSL